jgi:uroporphyrinogen-III decarboxylase
MLKEAIGDKIDAIFVSGTDFGTQKSLMISQEVFSSLFKPYYAQVNDWIHANTQWKTFYHSCGAVYNLLDDFVEMGVDILNPVQISAEGMSPKKLKEQYGDKLVFWGGGIDTQYTLPSGTPEEVVQEVCSNTAILGKNGGFVFTPVHNVQADVPPENLAAAYRAAASREGV